MSDVKKRTWNFILDSLPILAISYALLEWLSQFSVLRLDRISFLCYLLAAFSVAFLAEFTGHPGRMIRFLPIIPVAILVISQDRGLVTNALLAAVLIGVLCMLKTLPAWKWIQTALTVALIVMWVIEDDQPVMVAAGLILAAASCIAAFLDHAYKHWVLLLALAACLALIPGSDQEPMKWEALHKVIDNVENFIVKTGKDIGYFFEGLFGGDETAYTGYSEAGQISGGLTGSDREALLIETKSKLKYCYLRGSVYSELGPDGFSNREKPEQPMASWLSLYLSALAKTGTTPEEAACFSRVERAKITYQYLRTDDLILPANTFYISGNLEYGLDSKEGKGFSYDFNYITFDEVNPYYKEMAMKAQSIKYPAHYDEAAQVAKEFYGFHLANYITIDEYNAAIEAYQEVTNTDKYLGTELRTDRMEELALRLTKGCSSDLEKAERIEAYLRQYKYDMSVDLRDEDNYVDAFLFETESGYCVHYASAMVMLLRLNNIPARYVQGFLRSAKDEGVVPESCAHAWVEAFIPGLGWVEFEPTAAMENAEATSWRLRLAKREGGEPVEEGSGKVKEEPQYELPEVPPPEEAKEEKESSASVGEIFRTIGRYVLVVLGMAAVVILLIIAVMKVRYARLKPEEKLRVEVEHMKRRMNKKLPEGTSIKSVFEYLDYVEDETVKDKMKHLLEGYYKVRFRGDAAEPELIREMHALARSC